MIWLEATLLIAFIEKRWEPYIFDEDLIKNRHKLFYLYIIINIVCMWQRLIMHGIKRENNNVEPPANDNEMTAM